MNPRHSILTLLACFAHAARAQITVSVDLLSPGDEGFDETPAQVRCVDVYVDVATTDVWTAAGIRVVAESGGMLIYVDGDANVPGEQPRLINPGSETRFVTSLSQPRGRNSPARFENAGAAIAGAFDPTGPDETASPGLLNVAYFTSPPAVPVGATVVLRSVPLNAWVGTLVTGFDGDQGTSWALWWIPEPTTALMAAMLVAACRARRRCCMC